MTDPKEQVAVSTIEIAKLDPTHWDEYKQLRLRALEREPQAFAVPYARDSQYPDEKWKQRLVEVGSGKNWMLFARSGGKLVGMIGGYRDDTDLQNHSVQIWGVYVDSEMRGRGVAKKLMEGILEEFVQVQDINTVVLEVNSDQESAKKLYEKFGFRETRTYPHVMGDGIEHQITRMEKENLHI